MADIPKIASKPEQADDHSVALALAGGILAMAVAVKLGPKAMGSMVRAGEGLVARDTVAAGEQAMGANVESFARRVNLPSFGSIKPTGRPDPLVEETLKQRLANPDNIPGVVNVSADSWLARTYDAVKPGVVQMQSEKGKAMGSGFIVDSEQKLLATSHHVIDGLESKMHTVRLTDGKSFQAKVIGFDAEADVAVLKIADGGSHNFQALTLGTPLELSSKRAAAVGFPQTGDHLPVISPGRFTHAMYTDQSRLYFDMKTFPGNSGGPIVNRDGSVLGLVKSGTPADEYTAAGTIGANVEHLRAVLGLVRNREISQGPLAINSEILARGRAMLDAKDIFALKKAPDTMAQIARELAVKTSEAPLL